jgi:thioredoxin-dependent peroxiredoxin
MFRIMKFPAAAMLMAVPLCLQAQQTTRRSNPPATTSARMAEAPEVGAVAPDFTAQGADQTGAKSVTLHDLRGQVVVLAFYPLDRSSGCTAEMSKYRDEFSKIFGSGVTVLPISEDSVPSHVSWAHDAKFPFMLVSDTDGKIANEYGSMMTARPYASRTVFVIGKDGKVAYRNMKFGALDQHAYDDLAAAVAKAKSE